MNKQEKYWMLNVLLEIIGALNEGAAGGCDYWFKKLAERLADRAKKIMEVSDDRTI